MKSQDKALTHALLSWLLVVLIVALCLYLDLKEAQKIKVQPPLYPHHTIEEHRDAHHYHGIDFAEQKTNGQWIFKRDGQECKLFAYKRE